MATKKRPTKEELLKKMMAKKVKLDLAYIDEEPYRAVIRISAGTGVHEDTYIICFRLYAGIEVCKLFEEARQFEHELTNALLQMDNVMSFYNKYGKVMFGDNQAKLVTYALNYVTQMQEMVTPTELRVIYQNVENRLKPKK